MKTQAVKNIITFDYATSMGDVVIHIDKISDLDIDGNVEVSKLIAYVMRDDKAMVFNASPYTPLSDLHSMVKVWCDCGCPSDCDAMGFPRKWTKEDLHAWVAG